MKLCHLERVDYFCFVTIWIFARMKREHFFNDVPDSFVTIWIFARMKLVMADGSDNLGFVTIWIFARMKRNMMIIT